MSTLIMPLNDVLTMHSLPLEDAWLVPRWTFLPDEGRLTVIHPTRPHPYDPSRRHVPCAQQRDSAANAFVCSPLPTHLTAARSAAHHPRRMSPEQADAAAISRLGCVPRSGGSWSSPCAGQRVVLTMP